MTLSLVNFQIKRPEHSIEQAQVLEWVARAHTHAEALLQGWSPEEAKPFYQTLKEKIDPIGLGTGKIKKRGVQSCDFLHTDWKEMEIFQLDGIRTGLEIKKRKEVFDREAFKIMEHFYPENEKIAPHLIHVTCTGYAAPSAAQRIVSKRSLCDQTTVTHAYHMGCYASFPAMRIASGFFHSSLSPVDIVHTEMCSLHFNPTLHTTEQLVVQTLFADGFIKYSLIASETAQKEGIPHLQILALHEELIPDTSSSMSWLFEEWGMKMTISKEVPVLIKRNLHRFLTTLAEKAHVPLAILLKEGLYAIHPGGPKIISQIQDILELTPSQVQYSQEILENYGNMSSATLPHVFERILYDPTIPKGTHIIGLAFGPGLTISGGVFKKA